MTDIHSAKDEPLELATIHADALLLDALGRGEPADADDKVSALLAAWRTDLAAGIPPSPAARRDSISAAQTAPDSTATDPAALTSRRLVRRTRVARFAAAAAVVGILAGGTAIAVANATPSSPLWSITKVINPDRAHRLAAEDALTQARQAIADKRPDQAVRLLDKAANLISQVRDPQQAARLRAELADIRQLLVDTTTPAPLPRLSPGPQPSPSPGGTTYPSPPPHPSTGGADPGHAGQVTPSKPSLPGSTLLPTTPLRSLLPTTLPSLPGPGLGG